MAPNGAWEIEGEPYVSAPGSTFRWFRSRIVGGRTNHWGRIALRMAPVDFKVRSHDGMGDDWPLSYEDVAPYYDKVESLHRSFWDQGKYSQRARWNLFAAAQAALHRNHHQEGVRPSQYFVHSVASRDLDSASQRACSVSLLRAVRTRVHHGLQLQLQPGHDPSGGENRTLHADHGRDGAGIGCRQRWESRGGLLHRQSHAQRAAHSCPGFHCCGQRLRVQRVFC